MRNIYIISILFIINFLHADQLQQKIKTFIPANIYQTNEKFIKKIFANEASFYKNGSLDIQKILLSLKNNGLLLSKLPKPSNVSITTRINTSALTDNNPSFTFLSYSMNSILSSMGYSYFYITEAEKHEEKISLTYTLNSESNIDPIVVINNLVKRGYGIVDIHRVSSTHWIYDLSLIDSKIINSSIINKGENNITQINGKYWLTFNRKGDLQITPNDNTSVWYPKILIFDNEMNLIESIMIVDSRKNYKIHITDLVKHVLITDNYNASVLRNGMTFDFKY